MGLPEIVIVIATIALIVTMARKQKIGTTKDKIMSLVSLSLKFVLFCLLFLVFTPFVMVGVYKLAPYDKNVVKENLYFYVLHQKGDSYITKSYYHSDTATDNTEPVVALTSRRVKINVGDSIVHYSAKPLGPLGVRVTFDRATDSFVYDVRDGKVYPVGMKTAQGGWVVIVSLLFAAIAAAFTPRIVRAMYTKLRGIKKLNSQ